MAVQDVSYKQALQAARLRYKTAAGAFSSWGRPVGFFRRSLSLAISIKDAGRLLFDPVNFTADQRIGRLMGGRKKENGDRDPITKEAIILTLPRLNCLPPTEALSFLSSILDGQYAYFYAKSGRQLIGGSQPTGEQLDLYRNILDTIFSYQADLTRLIEGNELPELKGPAALLLGFVICEFPGRADNQLQVLVCQLEQELRAWETVANKHRISGEVNFAINIVQALEFVAGRNPELLRQFLPVLERAANFWEDHINYGAGNILHLLDPSRFPRP